MIVTIAIFYFWVMEIFKNLISIFIVIPFCNNNISSFVFHYTKHCFAPIYHYYLILMS